MGYFWPMTRCGTRKPHCLGLWGRRRARTSTQQYAKGVNKMYIFLRTLTSISYTHTNTAAKLNLYRAATMKLLLSSLVFCFFYFHQIFLSVSLHWIFFIESDWILVNFSFQQYRKEIWFNERAMAMNIKRKYNGKEMIWYGRRQCANKG